MSEVWSVEGGLSILLERDGHSCILGGVGGVGGVCMVAIYGFDR